MALINEPRETGLGPPLSMPISSETTPAADDVVAFARDQNVQLVDLKFTDLPGTWQHFAVAARELGEGLLSEGVGFDGSSIRGFQAINESDMLLVPDTATACIDPFHEYPTLSLVCEVRDPVTGGRTRATRATSHARQRLIWPPAASLTRHSSDRKPSSTSSSTWLTARSRTEGSTRSTPRRASGTPDAASGATVTVAFRTLVTPTARNRVTSRPRLWTR